MIDDSSDTAEEGWTPYQSHQMPSEEYVKRPTLSLSLRRSRISRPDFAIKRFLISLLRGRRGNLFSGDGVGIQLQVHRC